MSINVFNSIARGAAIVSVLTLSSLSVQAQTINIGVAANFAAPLMALINDYQTNVNPSAVFNVTPGSTGVLKAAILAGGTSGPYDLFLAADQAAPTAVAAVSGLTMNYPVGNAPFLYTTGSIVLWSDTVTTLGSGLPNPLNANLVIADPNTAPYGNAAMTVLNSSPWSLGLTKTGTYPSGYVYTAPNIDETYNRIVAHTYPYAYGFVAKSRVCSASGGVETFTGASHYEYVSSDPSHGYAPLTQYGVGINISGRSGADTQFVKDFIDYLLTDAGARTIISNFCYS